METEECYSMLLLHADAATDGIYGDEPAFLPEIFCSGYCCAGHVRKSVAGISLFWSNVYIAIAVCSKEPNV